MPFPTTGPTILLFKRFQTAWPNIDKKRYSVILEDENVSQFVEPHFENVSYFIDEILRTQIQMRDDYRELLLLCQIFLDKNPRDDVQFYTPGAYSRARWMTKAIYCLKIFLFRKEFHLTASEKNALREICIFVVIIYIKAWYTAALPIAAPYHDLNFLKELGNYSKINSKVSKIALKKFSNHLWYLATETTALAFFDETVSVDVKRKMVDKICEKPSESDICEKLPKRYVSRMGVADLLDKDIDFFVSSGTMAFFNRFQITSTFLDLDVSEWQSDINYQIGFQKVKKLKVVNDVAERGIKLITDYNELITHDEDQKQYIIQVIENYNKRFPNANKNTVIQPLEC